jgi:dephospho-CoA kinase
MAIRLGITGGIGSGKSVVSEILNIMGIPVYNSDKEAKRLIQTNTHIRKKLTEMVGVNVYQNGELNKKLLSSYIFSDSDHIAQVNNLVHPAVKEDFFLWCKQYTLFPVVGFESAILIEAGFASAMDKIVNVYAPIDIRINRAVNRDSSNIKQINERIKKQMSDDENRKYSDFIINNYSDYAILPQVISMIQKIMA